MKDYYITIYRVNHSSKFWLVFLQNLSILVEISLPILWKVTHFPWFVLHETGTILADVLNVILNSFFIIVGANHRIQQNLAIFRSSYLSFAYLLYILRVPGITVAHISLKHSSLPAKIAKFEQVLLQIGLHRIMIFLFTLRAAFINDFLGWLTEIMLTNT
jgi:hypothetical protein